MYHPLSIHLYFSKLINTSFFLSFVGRRKHQQLRPLDGQIQDALSQFNTGRLSGRDGNTTSDTNSNEPNANSNSGQIRKPVTTSSSTAGNPLETYLEYLDEVEPTPSELDDMTAYEETSNEPNANNRELRRFPSTSGLVNEIKSECEDNVDEYETEHNANQTLNEDDPDHTEEEHILNTLVLDNMEKRQQQQHQRLQHIQRLHSRALYEDFCAKRLRQQDSVVGNNVGGSGSSAMMGSQSSTSVSLPITSVITSSTHSSNVSLVRPTLAKPVDSINTTAMNVTNNNSLMSNGPGTLTTNNNNNAISSTIMSNGQSIDSANMMNTVVNSRMATASSHYHHNHHHPMIHNRYEMPMVTPSNCASLNTNTLPTTANSSPELCDCKTDPDAMFLMSLLPDIQKLNGRDRGKIKIAFQNILQDFLYPD